MKVCTKCGKEKPETEFWVKDKRTGRLHPTCKVCARKYHRVYVKGHYLRHRDDYLARVKARRLAIKRETRTRMLDYLQDKSCEICGETDIRTFDFDHIDPKLKSFSIGHAVAEAMSWDAILAEIQKCRILCANCHRKHTASQFGWYKGAA